MKSYLRFSLAWLGTEKRESSIDPYNTKYTVGEGLGHLAFKVDDLDKALEEARSSGHRTILKMKADGGRWAHMEDPDGIWIELY